MTDASNNEEDLEVLAGEYVLGTLPRQERQDLERRLAKEPELQRLVASWQNHFAALDDSAQDVPVDQSVWPKIEKRIGADRQENAAPRVVGPPPTAEASGGNVVDLSRRLRIWKSAAFVSTALAACLAVVVVLDGLTLWSAPPGQKFVAAVNRGGTLPALIVSVDTGNGQVTVRSLDAERPSNRDLEVWYVKPEAVPVSLGLLDQTETITNLIARAQLDFGVDGEAIAVSVEPIGGSPTGTPTGPVIYSGQLVPQD